MDDDEKQKEEDAASADGTNDETTEGPGSVTVDEPTDTSLEPHNDAGFRDGVPEPGRSEDESAD